MKVYGELAEHGALVFHSNVVDERPAGKTFYHSGISVRGLGKTCRLGSNQKNRYLRSAALMEPHTRSGWFDGRAHSYAAEHLRGVVSEEGDRLDMDESRQVEELLNYRDSTFRSGRPSSVRFRQSDQGNFEEYVSQ